MKKKYVVIQEQKRYIETTVEAESEEEAKRKVEEGKFDIEDVAELPPSEWRIIVIERKDLLRRQKGR